MGFELWFWSRDWVCGILDFGFEVWELGLGLGVRSFGLEFGALVLGC